MHNHILFFVKIFENEKYRDEFVSGKLFMNRLSYFRKIEGDADGNRGDQHEGVLSWLQPNKVVMTIGDIEVRSEDLAAPIMFQMNDHNRYHVFCLYAGYFDKKTTSNTPEELLEQIKISEECLKLGKFAAVIHNPREYIKRVKKAVNVSGYRSGEKLVQYYNPHNFHGTFSENDVIFRKRSEYSHQKEFRIFVDTETNDNNPYILDVGYIKDIVTICESDKINSEFRVSSSSHRSAE